jgi:hypothetical protein
MQTNQKIPSLITANWLRYLGACEEAVDEFEVIFPDGTAPSLKALTSSPVFNAGWLARKILAPPILDKFNQMTAAAWTNYNQATYPALAEYGRIRAIAWKSINRSLEGWNEFRQITVPAWNDYCRSREPAQAEYNAIAAPVLIELIAPEIE